MVVREWIESKGRGGDGVEVLNKEEKGLMDMDKSGDCQGQGVVIED